MTQSALLIAVPEADPVVARWRDRCDPAAEWGVPAHVTLLFPFEPRNRMDDLHALCGAAPAFDFTLTSVRWFGDSVVYLAPEPAQPFRDLTNAFAAAFPEFPPYGGAHDDVVPHLTIGDGAPKALLDAAANDVRPRLPIACTAREVVLMTGTQERDSWRVTQRFALAAAIT